RTNLRVVHRIAAANREPRIAARMPAKTDAWGEVFLRVRERLPVVTKPEIEREVTAKMHAVLNEQRVEPLWQLVAVDAEVDRLRVVLHVVQRQLSERRSRCVLERERAEDRRARLTARSTGGVMNDAAAESQIMLAYRPRYRVGELQLMTPEIRCARLSDRERHRAAAS